MTEAIFTPTSTWPLTTRVEGRVEVLGEIKDQTGYWGPVGRMFSVRNTNNGYYSEAFADELNVGVER